MTLAPELLAVLADRFKTIPWSVYADSMNTVFLCPQDHAPGEPCRRRFDRETALAFADELRASVHSARDMHGVEAIPEVTAYVLCYGVVWEQR